MRTAKKLVVVLLLVAVISSMFPLAASANGTIAWGAANVNGSGVRIRSGPGLDHSVLTHANQGDVIVIIEQTNSDWHQVNYHGTVGYVSVPLLDNSRKAANFNARGSISGSSVNKRAEPDTSSNSLGAHSSGTEMDIIGINNGWYKVVHNGVTGYIRSDLMSIVSGGSSSSEANAPKPLGQQIADFGVSLVGSKYRWAGSSPSTGFDCSGFVTYVMKQYGISLTRYSAGMFRDNGVSVARADLVPGDLVFFARNGRSIDHVGIYIGDGRFVHASSSTTGVIISNLSSRTLFGAKRVI